MNFLETKINKYNMKTYHNTGDLYREKFSGYTAEPPAEVWERIQQTMSKKAQFSKGKSAMIAVAVVAVGMIAYFGVRTSPFAENSLENQQQEQISAKTEQVLETTASAEKTAVAENAVSPRQETTTAPAQKAVEMEAVGVPIAVSMQNYYSSETDNQTVAIAPTPQKTEKETVVEKPKTAEKTENPSAKSLPIVVSKDTTVCENSEVKLFIINAKHVRWSTGEAKNTIFVNPSTDEQYSVSFTTAAGQDTTVFVNIKCIPCFELFVPSAFTPNGDGLNDVFIAESEEKYRFFEMAIYSRANKQLFYSKDIKRGWDGTFNGVLQPHGSYLYYIKYMDAKGKMQEKKGELLLIRE